MFLYVSRKRVEGGRSARKRSCECSGIAFLSHLKTFAYASSLGPLPQCHLYDASQLSAACTAGRLNGDALGDRADVAGQGRRIGVLGEVPFRFRAFETLDEGLTRAVAERE